MSYYNAHRVCSKNVFSADHDYYTARVSWSLPWLLFFAAAGKRVVGPFNRSNRKSVEKSATETRDELLHDEPDVEPSKAVHDCAERLRDAI